MASAAPAAAATDTDYQVNGANIRAAANGHSASIGSGYIGDGITMICSTYGPAAEGASVDYWILSRNHRTEVQGWSAGSGFAEIINLILPC